MMGKRKIVFVTVAAAMSLTMLFFQNCSKSLKTLQSSLSSSSTCPAKVTTLSKADGPIKKIEFSDFKKTNSSSGFQKASSSFTLAANEKITVTVNHECLLARNNSQDYPLTSDLIRRTKNKKFSTLESHTLSLPKKISFENLEALANDDECVEIVSPNIVIEKFAIPNDSFLVSQKHLTAIEYSQNYDYYFASTKQINSDTLIAVIDDGIDLNHSELRNLFWINTSEKNGTAGVDDDGNGYIDDINGYDFATSSGDPSHKQVEDPLVHSHGTHVAGLITATSNNFEGIAGLMARNSKIMPLNVFGTGNTTSSAMIDSAIRYAADMGAKVINISIGGKGSSAAIEQALIYAVSKGSIVLLAAGNNTESLTEQNFYSPASYGASINGVITVGATDTNPTKIGTLCGFSNYSTTYVEMSAPGCDSLRASNGILSTLRDNKYGYLGGTSMASPVAAGVVAVLYSYVRDAHNKILTPAEVENSLSAGSKNYATLNTKIKDGKTVNLSDLKTRIIASYATGGDTNPTAPTEPLPPKEGCP